MFLFLSFSFPEHPVHRKPNTLQVPRASLISKANSENSPQETSKSLSLLINLRVLGLGWNPVTDCMLYEVVLNFSTKKRGIRTGPNLKVDNLAASLPDVLTKQTVLEQVMKIYDPLGLVCLFTLWGKVYLREL